MADPLVGPLTGAMDRAGQALVRLDERLKRSPDLRDGFVARTHFQEAVAITWLEGDLVPLEDLVLHDGLADRRAPTPELTRAARLVRLRRRLEREPKDWALSQTGLLAPAGREETTDDAVLGQSDPTQSLKSSSAGGAKAGETTGASAYDDLPTQTHLVCGGGFLLASDPDHDEEGRLMAWRDVVLACENDPPVLAAARALDAWLILKPFERRASVGYLMASAELRRTITPNHVPPVAVGVRKSRTRWQSYDALDVRLASLLAAFETSAVEAIKQLNRLSLARQLMLQKCEGKRRNSKLPLLVDLFIASPFVSVPLATKKLKVTPAAVSSMFEQLGSTLPPELTGRGRYRAWGCH